MTNLASSASVTPGLPSRLCTRESCTTAAARCSASDQGPRTSWACASSNAARAYGRATVILSAMSVLDLRCQLVQQVRVGLRIDLALQHLRGRADSNRGYFTAQRFARV